MDMIKNRVTVSCDIGDEEKDAYGDSFYRCLKDRFAHMVASHVVNEKHKIIEADRGHFTNTSKVYRMDLFVFSTYEFKKFVMDLEQKTRAENCGKCPLFEQTNG